MTRPFAPLLAGAAVRVGLGVPFLLAGALQSVYDIGLYALFRHVPIGDAAGHADRDSRPDAPQNAG